MDSEERGQGRALRAQDPLGFPVEFFSKMEEAEWLWQKFDRHHGARIMRLITLTSLSRTCKAASNWYVDRLGFACTEYTETEGPKSEVSGAPGSRENLRSTTSLL